MSKHPSTRYEGKLFGKKKLENLANKKSSRMYKDIKHYKKENRSNNKNYTLELY